MPSLDELKGQLAELPDPRGELLEARKKYRRFRDAAIEICEKYDCWGDGPAYFSQAVKDLMMGPKPRIDMVSGEFPGLDARLCFGTHRGSTLSDVAGKAPDYLAWMCKQDFDRPLKAMCEIVRLSMYETMGVFHLGVDVGSPSRMRGGVDEAIDFSALGALPPFKSGVLPEVPLPPPEHFRCKSVAKPERFRDSELAEHFRTGRLVIPPGTELAKELTSTLKSWGAARDLDFAPEFEAGQFPDLFAKLK